MADTPGDEAQADTSNQQTQVDEQPASPNAGSRPRLAVVASVLAAAGIAAAFVLPNFNADYFLSNLNAAKSRLSRLAELLPHETASVPIPDPVISALNDIQSAQQMNASTLQRQMVLMRQDAANLEFLRQSATSQQVDLKKISGQLSLLTARVDSLHNAVGPLTTSSISTPVARTQAGLAAASRKRASALRLSKPEGPVSIGGAPLSAVPPPGWGA